MQRWPGLDADFQGGIVEHALGKEGRRLRRSMNRQLVRARGQSSPLGPPVVLRRPWGATVRRFAEAYHRCVEAIILDYGRDARVREVMPLPRALAFDLPVDGAARPRHAFGTTIRYEGGIGVWRR